jgi:hypothetical protein
MNPAFKDKNTFRQIDQCVLTAAALSPPPLPPSLPGSSIVVTIHLLTLCEQTTTSQLPNVFDMALLNSSAAATTFYGLKKKAPLCLLT